MNLASIFRDFGQRNGFVVYRVASFITAHVFLTLFPEPTSLRVKYATSTLCFSDFSLFRYNFLSFY